MARRQGRGGTWTTRNPMYVNVRFQTTAAQHQWIDDDYAGSSRASGNVEERHVVVLWIRFSVEALVQS